MKTCKECMHFKVCSWVPEPYSGSHSGGFLPSTGYELFHRDYYQAFGNNCSEFKLSITSENILFNNDTYHLLQA